ncbi:MAG: hypothetical protein K0R62_2317 [Nonomuraea muscovyensis]|nr:hypothetical protein [Nonomuraea muscovyensis]
MRRIVLALVAAGVMAAGLAAATATAAVATPGGRDRVRITYNRDM